MTDNDPNRTSNEGPVVPTTIAVALVATADVIDRGGLPEPLSVRVSTRFGLDLEMATHAELRAWVRRLGLTVQPYSSQPYVDRDGVLCQLTSVYGTWRDTPTTVHCCEPVHSMPAAGDEVDR